MRVLVTVFCLSLFCLSGVAQNTVAATDPEKILIISKNSEDRNPRMLRQGKRVRLILNDGHTVIKGRFSIFGDNALIVNDNSYDLASIAEIRTSWRATKIIGGVLGAPGLVITGVGAGMVIKGSVDEDGCTVFYGILVAAVGLVPTVIGVPMFFIGKNYKTSDWSYKIGELK